MRAVNVTGRGAGKNRVFPYVLQLTAFCREDGQGLRRLCRSLGRWRGAPDQVSCLRCHHGVTIPV